jgi:penicillin amidase
MHEVQLRHPLSASLGWFDRFFSIGPVEMDGDATTVRQVTRNLGPSLRFIATPGSWDDSLLTLTTGESGQAASPHYKDQWPEYRDGGALKLEFERVDARSTLLLRPR